MTKQKGTANTNNRIAIKRNRAKPTSKRRDKTVCPDCGKDVGYSVIVRCWDCQDAKMNAQRHCDECDITGLHINGICVFCATVVPGEFNPEDEKQSLYH